MSNKLTGKVAVVTGASKGIGAAIAVHLAVEGASVVVNYASSKDGAERVVASITGKGGKAIAVQADVTKPVDVESLFSTTQTTYGRLDILVNSAGMYEFGSLEAITPANFHKQFDLNVLSLLLASQQAVKYFGAGGGSIINISSAVTSITPPNMAVYNGSKGAVDAITRTLAKELGSRKIRVNSINPGMVLTEGVRSAGLDTAEIRSMQESVTPLGRIGQPDDIATAAVFLASADSSWITGEVINVAGGQR
jgi:3-oxoacyl-[acyl-carrier protein] reductase